MTEVPFGEKGGSSTPRAARGHTRPLEAGGPTTQPRIAMFVHSFDDRAFSRLTARLCWELTAMDVPVTFIAARRTPEATVLPPSVRVMDLGLENRPTLLGLGRLARALRSADADVVFAHGNGPARTAILARALGRARAGIIVVEHVHYSTFYRTFFRRRRWLRDILTALLYPRAYRVAAVSPGAVADLEARFPAIRGKTLVLPSPGPDVDEVKHLASTRVDDPWFEGVDPPRVICSVANLLPRKGQDVLVRSLPAVRAAAGDVRLLLIGREDAPGFARELMRSAGELGVGEHVRLLGHVADPLPFVAGSAVFAHAATTEGFGMAIVEAMACGVPVVATDSPAGPAYVLDDGRCGILVPVGDERALTDGIVRMLDDRALRDRVVESARRRARLFSPGSVAKAYLELATARRDQRGDRHRAADRSAPRRTGRAREGTAATTPGRR